MLVDTSVLVRTLQPHHPLYSFADRAIRILSEQGRKLHVVAQNLIELWVVATRPLGENGLGMTAAEARPRNWAPDQKHVPLPAGNAVDLSRGGKRSWWARA